MKYLALAFLLCALAPLSNADCFRWKIEPGLTHCQDTEDGTWHAVGSKWRSSRCMDCTCGECCTAYLTPRKIPDECVSFFDSEACEYIVHKRDNSSVLCPVLAAVGK